MENPPALPQTPKNPPKNFRNELRTVNRPMRTPLTPPPAPGFTRKRMAKAFASLGDDDDQIDTKKPAAPVRATAGLLDGDKENNKKAENSAGPSLQSPIWTNYKEKDPAQGGIDIQVTRRLLGELNNGNYSVVDGQTQTVAPKSSVRDSWTQTEDSFFNSKGSFPLPARTESNDYTPAVISDGSEDCQDDSSPSSEVESTPITEISTPTEEEEEHSAMEDVSDSAEIIRDLGQPTEVTKVDDSKTKPGLCEKWFGTSFWARNLLSQDNRERQSQVEGALKLRDSLIEHLSAFPYNPTFYADLAAVYNQLGFTDVAASNAYKAILLVECALSDSTTTYSSLPHVREEVLKFMRLKHVTNSAAQIDDELNEALVYAYQELLFALIYCGAFWDGLGEAMKAKKLYPGNAKIYALTEELKSAYLERCELLASQEAKLNENEQKTFSKRGKIITIKYPWLDEKLFYRTPRMLRQVNKSLKTSSCEVRPVRFGSDSKTTIVPAENTDVGALGVFANKDISKGELFMVDHTLLSVTNVPGSKKHHCEACQSFLLPPYFKSHDRVYPKCCKSAAYCSTECRDAAAGLHSVICGKALDHHYKEGRIVTDLKSQNMGYMPKSLLLCRVMAVILPDIQRTSTNPLQHNLAARLVPNYSPVNVLHEEKNSTQWTLKENVVVPTKFLLQIGVDIFSTRDWDQEVIQTLDWRVQNNANMGISSIYPEDSIEFHQAKQHGIENFLNSNSINPNYVFFNHSCLYNAYWNGSTECDTNVRGMIDMEGNMMRPGNSAVRCFAARDIKKNEEIFISYVGEAGTGISVEERKYCRDSLNKWFPGGCGCAICEEENRTQKVVAGGSRNGEAEGHAASKPNTKTGPGAPEDTVMGGTGEAKTVVIAVLKKRMRPT